MESIINKKFHSYSSFSLSSDDISTLSLLYSPLIGSEPTVLYLSLQNLLERNNLKSEEYTHQELFDLFGFTEKSFLKARYQLEGIGLLKTYKGESDYIYLLCPPLTPKNFIKDVTLGLYLYAKIGKNTFDKLYNHFKIEKIDKANYENVTKNFEDVYTSMLSDQMTFSKFQYILGRKAITNIKINNKDFNFDLFANMINQDLLETGINKQFMTQITNLAYVYAFNEEEMAELFHESINKAGLFDYRLLKKKANVKYSFHHQTEAPQLLIKDVDIAANVDLIEYLDKATAAEILENMMPDFPNKYLNTITDIYANIDLPRGVLNCMIVKVLKDKSGELPNLSYFKKMSETWIANNIFTTSDAIKFVTTFDDGTPKQDSTANKYKTGGFDEL